MYKLVQATDGIGGLIKEKLEEGGEKIFGTDRPDPANIGPIEIAGDIVTYVMGFLGVVFVFLIIYAGIMWMTAGGNDEQVAKARSMINRALLGLLITLSVFVIVRYVIIQIIIVELAGLV